MEGGAPPEGPGWRQREPLVTNGGTKRRFGEVLRRFIAFGGIWERFEENRKFEFLANFGHFGTWPA